MSRRNEESWLTAAECAARTGLTVRALRVYEEYGLIAPQRTPSGWRCYGEADLIRLNTITLLKSAGLSLAQIRMVTHLNEKHPSLQQVLELQIETWKAKQAEATRGRQIVEATLRNLEAQQSVSIDDLCNLVRNLAMSDDTMNDGDERDLSLDPKVLDNYIGQYRFGEFAVLDITREASRLYSQSSGELRHEATVESDTEFAIRSLGAHIRFVTDAQGRATAVVIHQHGARRECPRLEAPAAQALLKRCEERIAANVPQPGSEAALARLLDGILSGNPNYEEMSAPLASVVRLQLPQLQTIARYLGPVQAITFQGVGKQGWDVYEVRRANGTGQWRIVLNANGGIENAAVHASDARMFESLFGEWGKPAAAVPNQQPSPGSEAALRRFVDSVRDGAPNFDEMTPAFAQALAPQQPQMQVFGQRLGKIVGVEYRGAVTETYDVFDVQHERGTMRRRIALTPDGKIAAVAAVLTGTGLSAGP